MPQKICKECQTIVPPKVENCPKCNAPYPKRKSPTRRINLNGDSFSGTLKVLTHVSTYAEDLGSTELARKDLSRVKELVESCGGWEQMFAALDSVDQFARLSKTLVVPAPNPDPKANGPLQKH